MYSQGYMYPRLGTPGLEAVTTFQACGSINKQMVGDPPTVQLLKCDNFRSRTEQKSKQQCGPQVVTFLQNGP